MKKFKKNNSAFITFFRSHKYIAMCLLLIASVAIISFGIRYGRYTYNIVKLYYFRTQNFYFGSNKLEYVTDGNVKTYGISPWDAVSELPITITVNSLDNSLKGTTSVVKYNVSFTCTNLTNPSTPKVDCYLKKGSDTYTSMPSTPFEIPYNPNDIESDNDSFVISVVPEVDGGGNTTLNEEEEIMVHVEATSTSPYEQTLQANFKITVGKPGIKYEISDEAGRSYLDALITNTNGTASYVGLKFNINKFTFDMSNIVYNNCVTVNNLNNEECAYRVTSDNGYEYISEIYFKVNSRSSALVRFYKDGNNVNSSFEYKSSRPDEYPNGPEIQYCVMDDELTAAKINGCTWY